MQSFQQRNTYFCSLHSIKNCYAYCIYDDCKDSKRWLCIQCYQEKTHKHMNEVLSQYQFVIRIQQSIGYFNQSRICEITNILLLLEIEDIDFKISLNKLKPICEDTRETYQTLKQLNDFEDIFGCHNNQMEFLRYFIKNNDKWSKYIELINESIFHYTQRFSLQNNLIRRLNLLLRTPGQFYTKWKQLNHKLEIKQISISPNQQFIASLSNNIIRLFYNYKLIRKIHINLKLSFITFNLESTQICAGFRNGNILIYSILDLSSYQINFPYPPFEKIDEIKIHEIIYASENQIFILSVSKIAKLDSRIVKYDILTKKTLFEIVGQNMQFNKSRNQLITLDDQMIYFIDSGTGKILKQQYIDGGLVEQIQFIENQDVIVAKLNQGRIKTQKYLRQPDLFLNEKQFQPQYKMMCAINQNILILVYREQIILLYSYNLGQIKTINLINDLRNYKVCRQSYDSQTLIIENKGQCRFLKLK